MQERLLYRVSEAAKLLGVSRTKAYSLAARGVIPVVRFDGSVRVPVDALHDWIKNQTEILGAQQATP